SIFGGIAKGVYGTNPGENDPSRLETINLSRNGISSTGADAVVTALTHHLPQLKTLNLSNNSIRDEGAEKLYSALVERNKNQEFSPVTTLNIEENGISAVQQERLRIIVEEANQRIAQIREAQLVAQAR